MIGLTVVLGNVDVSIPLKAHQVVYSENVESIRNKRDEYGDDLWNDKIFADKASANK
jgi:hypothetical protein